MVLAGLAITFLGFLIAVLGLGMTSSVSGRMIFVLAGLAVCLFGIIGVVNRAYLKNALWRK
jgi:hypothetical protein